jgi:hypothetical protein
MEDRINAMQKASERLAAIRNTQPNPTNDPQPNATSSSEIASANALKSPLSMDLVNLANSAMEAKGNLNLAKLKMDQAGKSTAESEIAEQTLINASQRFYLIKDMISISTKSAKTDMERCSAKVQAGLAQTQELEAATSRYEMLRTILHSLD